MLVLTRKTETADSDRPEHHDHDPAGEGAEPCGWASRRRRTSACCEPSWPRSWPTNQHDPTVAAALEKVEREREIIFGRTLTNRRVADRYDRLMGPCDAGLLASMMHLWIRLTSRRARHRLFVLAEADWRCGRAHQSGARRDQRSPVSTSGPTPQAVYSEMATNSLKAMEPTRFHGLPLLPALFFLRAATMLRALAHAAATAFTRVTAPGNASA